MKVPTPIQSKQLYPHRLSSVIKIVLFCLLIFLSSSHVITSDENLDNQLHETQSQLQSALDAKQSTQSRLEQLEQLKQEYQSSLSTYQSSYQLTLSQINLIRERLTEKQAELEQINHDLDQTEVQIQDREISLRRNVRQMYIADSQSSWLAPFSPTRNLNLITQIFVYRNAVIRSTQEKVRNLQDELTLIKELRTLAEEVKEQLAAEEVSLNQRQLALQSSIYNTTTQISNTQGEVQSLSQSLAGIDQQISSLTQRQREILAAKAAAALASTSVGNIEIDQSAIEKSPPQDGNVYFSFWTYGYPHRVGMNQYGAFGRAIAGQSVDQILHAYYSNVSIVDWDGPENITITTGSGNQTINFEDDYLMGIGEMPSCWGSPDRGGLEALKAQAIAARTYALAYTNNGQNPICTTQSCQVYVGSSKVTGTCGEYWRQAVEETEGRVIAHNGSPITAWYASTAGGFTLSSAEVWGGAKPYATGIADVDGSGQAYDGPAHGDSPWYHKAWGNEPWLSVDQVTDMFNAALLPSQYDNQLAASNNGGFTPEQVVQTLQQHGITPITNLTSVEVVDQNNQSGANTAQVQLVRAFFNGGGEAVVVSGSRFKFVFNLRSPGTDALWTTRFDIITAAEL